MIKIRFYGILEHIFFNRNSFRTAYRICNSGCRYYLFPLISESAIQFPGTFLRIQDSVFQDIFQVVFIECIQGSFGGSAF